MVGTLLSPQKIEWSILSNLLDVQRGVDRRPRAHFIQEWKAFHWIIKRGVLEYVVFIPLGGFPTSSSTYFKSIGAKLGRNSCAVVASDRRDRVNNVDNRRVSEPKHEWRESLGTQSAAWLESVDAHSSRTKVPMIGTSSPSARKVLCLSIIITMITSSKTSSRYHYDHQLHLSHLSLASASFSTHRNNNTGGCPVSFWKGVKFSDDRFELQVEPSMFCTRFSVKTDSFHDDGARQISILLRYYLEKRHSHYLSACILSTYSHSGILFLSANSKNLS